MKNKISVIVLGTSTLLYTCATEIHDFYHGEVDLKVIDVAYSPMKRKYKEQFGKVDAFSTKNEIFDWLETVEEATYLLSINNPYLLPKRVCDNKNLVLINLHHSLLPKHPGRNAEAWTIFEMDRYGGITFHYITPGVDEGAIICQRRHELTPNLTSVGLLRICEGLAIDALKTELLPFECLEAKGAAEQTGPKNNITLAKDIPNEGYLDIKWDTEKISAFLRAMDYGPKKVLGQPKIQIEKNTYTIRKYTVFDIDSDNETQPYQFSKEERTVIFRNNKTQITLLLK